MKNINEILSVIIEMRTIIEIQHKHNGIFDSITIQKARNLLRENLTLLENLKGKNMKTCSCLGDECCSDCVSK